MERKTSKNGKPSWIRRAAIGLAALFVAALFWPPRWVPEPWGPGAAITPLMVYSLLTSQTYFVDTEGKRTAPPMYAIDTAFVDAVEAAATEHGEHFDRAFLGDPHEGAYRLPYTEWALFMGVYESPRDGTGHAPTADPFANGPLPKPMGNEVVYFHADGAIAFTVEIEVPEAVRPLQSRIAFSEGLAALPTAVADEGTPYTTVIIGFRPERHQSRIHTPTNFGYLALDGEWAISPRFEDAYAFREGLAAVKVEGRWGFINPEGEFVIEPKFEAVRSFSEALAAAKQEDGTWGYIRHDGSWAITPRFRSAGSLSEGLAHAREVFEADATEIPQYGYIDARGEWVIAPRFHYASPFSEGLAAVQTDLNGRYGYIDRSGDFVIPARFDLAHPFHDGAAMVTRRVPLAWTLIAAFRAYVFGTPYWKL